MFNNFSKREGDNASNLNTQLNFEADTIEEVLASFGHTDVYVSKITSTSVANAFELKITPATRVRDMTLMEILRWLRIRHAGHGDQQFSGKAGEAGHGTKIVRPAPIRKGKG